MMKQMLGSDFKYEDDLLYKRNYSFTKTINWSCLNYNKPNKKGYIRVGVNGRNFYLNRLVYFFHHYQNKHLLLACLFDVFYFAYFHYD